MEPTDLSSKHPDADYGVPRRVHGRDHPAANEHVPKSVWQPGVVKRLADYIKHLRKVDQQPDQPDKPGQPDQRHLCRLSAGYTCACPRGVCACDDATYRYARGPYIAVGARRDAKSGVRAPEPNHLGNFRCPISGQLCSQTVCRDWCESGVDYTKT